VGTGIVYALPSIRLLAFAPPACQERLSLDRVLEPRWPWWRHIAEPHAIDRSAARAPLAAVRAGEPGEGPVSMLAADIGNLRAAISFGLDTGDTQLVREITGSLHMYWVVRGLFTEARQWLDRALALDDAQDLMRKRLLSALGGIAHSQGDYTTALAASDEAAALAMRLAGVTDRFELLQANANGALTRDDLDAAEALLHEARDVAVAADNGVGTSWARPDLVYIANRTGRHDLASDLLAENLPFVRARGQTRCERYMLCGMADTTVQRGRYLTRTGSRFLRLPGRS
jgi:hypothetical protein